MATSTNDLLKGRWTIWIISLAFSALAGFGVLQIVGQAGSQVTYYVMNQDVPARTPITMDVVTARTTNAEGRPETALSIGDITNNALFARVALRKGDPVTASVVGPLERITTQLPTDYVAVSLEVDPKNAVAGKIARGDYVDIAAVTDQGGSEVAHIYLHHVLVMDVSVSPKNIASSATSQIDPSSAPGPESLQVRGGIPMLYTLAVSRRDFAVIALLRDKNIFLALSPVSQGVVDVSVSSQGLEKGTVRDSSPVTDKIPTTGTSTQTTPTPTPTDPTIPAPTPTPTNP